MAPLSSTRLLIHAAIPFFLSIYLFWLKVSFWELFFTITITVFFDLIYLSYIIIQNMNVTPSEMSFENKRIVITGGSSGIGFSIAKKIIVSNASQVILIARNEEKLKASIKELSTLKSHTQKISYISIDLAKEPEKIKEEIEKLMKDIGSIEVLINCAGLSIPGEFLDLSVKDFETMINTNYLTSVYITHAVIPYMVKERYGQIVFLSSVGGQLPVVGFTAYSPSKYAIRSFAEILHAEVRPYGIGVSLAFPPDTKTPGFEEENKRKPKITQIMSEQVGLWESDYVAEVIINGIKDRKFMIGFGTDGYFINAMTSGAAPSSSITEFWAHTFLSPIIRIYYLIVMQNFFTNVVDNEFKNREKKRV